MTLITPEILLSSSENPCKEILKEIAENNPNDISYHFANTLLFIYLKKHGSTINIDSAFVETLNDRIYYDCILTPQNVLKAIEIFEMEYTLYKNKHNITDSDIQASILPSNYIHNHMFKNYIRATAIDSLTNRIFYYHNICPLKYNFTSSLKCSLHNIREHNYRLTISDIKKALQNYIKKEEARNNQKLLFNLKLEKEQISDLKILTVYHKNCISRNEINQSISEKSRLNALSNYIINEFKEMYSKNEGDKT